MTVVEMSPHLQAPKINPVSEMLNVKLQKQDRDVDGFYRHLVNSL